MPWDVVIEDGAVTAAQRRPDGRLATALIGEPIADLDVAIDLQAAAADSGSEALRRFATAVKADVARWSSTLTSDGSEDAITSAGARLPLRAIDFDEFARGAITNAVTLCAIGVDGDAFAADVERAGGDAAAQDAARAVAGTVVLSVTQGLPLPDVTVSLAANAAFDRWIAASMPNGSAVVERARQMPTKLPATTWLPCAVWARRDDQRWWFSTSDGVISRAPVPAIDAEKIREQLGLATGDQVAGAFIQDSRQLAGVVGMAAAAAGIALAGEVPSEDLPKRIHTGSEEEPVTQTRSQLAAQQRLAQAVVSASAALKPVLPTATAVCRVDGDGATITAKNLLIGWSAPPLATLIAWYAAPTVAPVSCVDHQPRLALAMRAASEAARWNPWGTFLGRVGGGAYPEAEHELEEIALHHSSENVRTDAIATAGYWYRDAAHDIARVTPLLRRTVRDPSPLVRTATVRWLSAVINSGASDDGVAQTIVTALNDISPDVRVAVLEMLGRVAEQRRSHPGGGDPPATVLPVLIDRLQTAAGEERLAVVSAIGAYRSPGAVDALLAAARDTNAQLRGRSLVALAAIDDERVTPLLLDAIRSDEDHVVVTQIANVLAARGRGHEVADAVAVAMDRVKDEFQRYPYAALLARLNDARGIAVLKAISRSDDAQVRLVAVQALAASTSTDVVPVMLDAVGDADVNVALAAMNVLPGLLDRVGPANVPATLVDTIAPRLDDQRLRLHAAEVLARATAGAPASHAASAALARGMLCDDQHVRTRCRDAASIVSVDPGDRQTLEHAVVAAQQRFGPNAFKSPAPAKAGESSGF